MTAHPITARTISDALDRKPLRPFGSASIHRPVSEGIARANDEDEQLRVSMTGRERV